MKNTVKMNKRTKIMIAICIAILALSLITILMILILSPNVKAVKVIDCPKFVVSGKFFDIGLKAEILYTNGKTLEIFIDSSMFDDTNKIKLSTIGEQNINFTFDKCVGSFTVTILSSEELIPTDSKLSNYKLRYIDGQTVAITSYVYNSESEANVILPQFIDGFSVTKIGDNAFKGQDIISVYLPTSITEIGDYAFANCKRLEYFYIPSSVKKIGKGVWAVESGFSALNCLHFGGANAEFDLQMLTKTPFTSIRILIDDVSGNIFQKLSQEITIENDKKIKLNINGDLTNDSSEKKREQQIDSKHKDLSMNNDRPLAVDNWQKSQLVTNSEMLLWALRLSLKPTFNAGSKIENLYNSIKHAICKITSENMTQYEKVHAYYDYICKITTYDYATAENKETNDAFNTAFSLEGVFELGVAVCDSYAKAMETMCLISGINAIRTTGKVKTGILGSPWAQHAWNKVMIDNNWYNVDCTNGDCKINDKFDITSHYFLLCSDEALNGRIEDVETYACENNYTENGKGVYEIGDYIGVNYDHKIDSQEELNSLILDYRADLFKGNGAEFYFAYKKGMQSVVYTMIEKAFREAQIWTNPVLIVLTNDSNGNGLVFYVKKTV
ncbi:MAG: leucine-rich repeat protein [Clostridia bacterium]